jgi:hypothetical protein
MEKLKKIHSQRKEESHKKSRGSRFERVTLIEAASRKLRSSKCKLADSAVGVAPNKFAQPIRDEKHEQLL